MTLFYRLHVLLIKFHTHLCVFPLLKKAFVRKQEIAFRPVTESRIGNNYETMEDQGVINSMDADLLQVLSISGTNRK